MVTRILVEVNKKLVIVLKTKLELLLRISVSPNIDLTEHKMHVFLIAALS